MPQQLAEQQHRAYRLQQQRCLLRRLCRAGAGRYQA
jgi:hypothetical protein